MTALSELFKLLFVVVCVGVPGGVLVLAAAWPKIRIIPPPHLPVRNGLGTAIYTEADWRRDARRQRPFSYFLSQTIPGWLKRRRCDLRLLWLYVTKRRTPGEVLLAEAFWVLTRYVNDHMSRICGPAPDDPVEHDFWTLDQELLALYEWWTVGYGLDRALCMRVLASDVSQLEKHDALCKVEASEQHHLRRLVEARRGMR